MREALGPIEAERIEIDVPEDLHVERHRRPRHQLGLGPSARLRQRGGGGPALRGDASRRRMSIVFITWLGRRVWAEMAARRLVEEGHDGRAARAQSAARPGGRRRSSGSRGPMLAGDLSSIAETRGLAEAAQRAVGASTRPCSSARAGIALPRKLGRADRRRTVGIAARGAAPAPAVSSRRDCASATT